MWSLLLVLIRSIASANRDLNAGPPPSGCQLADPIPNDRTCELRGTINFSQGAYGDDPDPAILDSFSECLDLCARRDICSTFGYDRISKHCTLFTENATELNFKHLPGSSTIYSEKLCYDCPALVCPQSPHINLIDNGGFEYSSNYTTTGPWRRFVYLRSNKHEGEIVHPGSRGSENAWHCKFPPKINDYCILYQYFEICKPGTYSVTFDYKAHKSQRYRGQIYSRSVTVEAGYSTLTTKFPPNGTKGWRSQTIYFECNNDRAPCDNSISFYNYPDVILDNIEVYPIPTLRYAPGARNLIENGNFERGIIDPWTTHHRHGRSSFSVVSGEYYSGYQLMWKEAENDPNGYAEATLIQRVPTTPGKTYLLTFDYHSTEEIGLDFYIGGVGGDTSLYYEIIGSGEYQHQIPFLAHHDNTYLHFLFFNFGPRSGIAIFDNADFREVQ